MRFKHDSRKTEYRAPFGAVETGSEISLSIDVYEAAPESVRLMLWHGDDPDPQYINMEESAADAAGASYSARISAPEEGCLLWYAFEIEAERGDDDGASRQIIYYGNNHDGLGGEGSVYYDDPQRYQITVYKHSEVPSWYKDGIVYQIFPDRFARDEDWRERTEAACERINKRRSDTRRFVQEDWTKPAFYERDGSGRVTGWPMYGGSLKGIEERLDYIKSLGATCIYLNPVFEATSNHRYDTGDYMHIEPALGTDEDFERLAKAARERGIRIILDGVFSHTGCDSIYFDKYGNYKTMRGAGAYTEEQSAGGAWSGPDSPYRSWYKFDENEACGYKSWWGVDDLPEVNENDPAYREYILGEDGVVAHWIRKGASGWRLDVADELPDSFIAETRKRIKETDPDALLLGEVWEDASNKISYGERRRYLMGDELDSTMHYPLRDILLAYINYTISAPGAEDRMMSLAENYPEQNLYGALNIIGSHDRERIMTMMAAEQDYPSATKKVRLLSVLQYCLPGVPCVYYGDEAGLMGGSDPANRSGFPWGFENFDLGYHYRMLGLIYDEHPALKSGSFDFLSGKLGLGDDIFAFTRSGRDIAGNEEVLLILANRSYGPAEVRLGDAIKCGYALELLTSTEMPLDEEGSLGTVSMDALSVKIISLRKERPASELLERSAGVICHVSSLPGRKLGKGARHFVDYIASAGFSIWQILPLNPAGMGNSPYSSYAAFAGEPAFIDRDELPPMDGYSAFIKNNGYWLYDYIAFTILREANELRPWYEWPEEQRFAGSAGVLGRLSEDQKKRAKQLAEDQYFFAAQWADLKAYANSKGVILMGDLPMFMAADSADIWANKDIFMIGHDGMQKSRAGVPPDAFSEDGQDWGNPLYNWDKLRGEGYGWWLRRMRQCAERFDILRIDHFRGMSEYYSIPKGKTPKEGSWQHSAGLGFIEAVKKMLRDEGLGMKLLAEDLGFLDAGVKNLLKLSGLPGMDIWQFSAGEMMEACGKEPEKTAGRAFYTGTHDNDTLAGWLMSQKQGGGSKAADSDADAAADDEALREEAEMLKTECETEALEVIRKIYESPAGLAMMQLQDVFLLGSEARMNVPGVAEGNWNWKVPGDSIEEAFDDAAERADWLRALAEKTGRLHK